MTVRDFSRLPTHELADEAARAATALDMAGQKVEGDLAALVSEIARRVHAMEEKAR